MHRTHQNARSHRPAAVAIAATLTAAVIAAGSIGLGAGGPTGADPVATSHPRLAAPAEPQWWVPPGLELLDRLLATGHFYPSMGWL